MQAASRPIDHLSLAGNANATALVIPRGEGIDFAGLEARTGRIARWLAEQDLPPGSRIASWMPKGALSSILPLGVARAGHVYVPINPLLKRAQVAHILADSGASILITQQTRSALLEPGDLPANARIVEAGVLDAAMVEEDRSVLPPSQADPSSLCEILYTSGSTGRPKGVMLSHANLALGAQAVADYLGLTPEDRTLCVLPFSFDYGQNQLFAAWQAGGCAVPFDYLLPRDVAKAVARHGITTLAGVPPLWVQLLEVDWPAEAINDLKRLTNSGGALTRPLVAGLRDRFPAADLYAMYGLTEAFRSTYLPPTLIETHPDSIGRAIPHAEVLVVRPDGGLAEPGEAGELVHCGPLVAQGYWHDPERTAERFRPAPAESIYGGIAVWSGDTVRRDEDGLLYFVGRDDAMIKSAGNRISPTEVEEAAVAVPGITEAAAIGVPDTRLGQAIRLFVRGDGEAMDRLRDALRRDLPNFMQPRDIIPLAHLPRTPNGKIDRIALLQESVA